MKRSEMSPERLARIRAIQRLYMRKWYRKNKEKWAANVRQWQSANIEKVREYKRRSQHNNPDVKRVSVKRYHAKNKGKLAAHRAVGRALKSGKLKKAYRCQGCGAVTPLQGHHKDYSKKLDVVWLCAFCHSATHRGK